MASRGGVQWRVVNPTRNEWRFLFLGIVLGVIVAVAAGCSGSTQPHRPACSKGHVVRWSKGQDVGYTVCTLVATGATVDCDKCWAE